MTVLEYGAGSAGRSGGRLLAPMSSVPIFTVPVAGCCLVLAVVGMALVWRAVLKRCLYGPKASSC